MHDLGTFADLATGFDEKHLTDLLGVSLLTLRRYRAGSTKPPRAALLLLHLHQGGDFSALWGKRWEGFSLDKYFRHPFWRHGFTAGDLRAHFFHVQMLPALQRENDELRAELARLVITRAMDSRKIKP